MPTIQGPNFFFQKKTHKYSPQIKNKAKNQKESQDKGKEAAEDEKKEIRKGSSQLARSAVVVKQGVGEVKNAITSSKTLGQAGEEALPLLQAGCRKREARGANLQEEQGFHISQPIRDRSKWNEEAKKKLPTSKADFEKQQALEDKAKQQALEPLRVEMVVGEDNT